MPSNKVALAAFNAFDKLLALPSGRHAHLARKAGEEFRQHPAARRDRGRPPPRPAGQSEGSKLFQQIINKEMPYDLYYEFDTSNPEVTEADIEASGPGSPPATRGEGLRRAQIRHQATSSRHRADLEERARAPGQGMRYLTLANLYNSCCASGRHGGLSPGRCEAPELPVAPSDVLRLTTVDEAQTSSPSTCRAGLGAGRLESFLSATPMRSGPTSRPSPPPCNSTGSPLPYSARDWFVFTASQPPLYDAC